jgi:arylsulfatase A-like enzyme
LDRGTFALLFCLLVLAPAACVRREAPPNVLLIVLDTLRADRLGSFGNRRGLTPFLDELAARGTVFTNTYAASSWTCPSVASLFTSRYPSQHHVVRFTSKLPDEEVTLAETLAPLGYLGGGFSANFRIAEPLGYAQGFQHWRVYLGDPKARGDQLRRESLAWLDGIKNKPGAPPIFLYLQYIEPHGPYVPPEPYRSRFQRDGNQPREAEIANKKLVALRFEELTDQEVDLLRSLYDGEVASLDAELRVLFAELGRRGFLDRCVIIITADHGEEFREHGGMIHGFTLYNETLRVPLLVLAPGYAGGRIVRDNVSLLDLAPTVLDLLHRPREPRFEGRSLVPLLAGKSLQPRDILGQLEADVISDVRRERGLKESPGDSRRQTEAIIRGPVKVMVQLSGATETYDLATDPGESRPNPPALQAETAELAKVLREGRSQLASRAAATQETVPLDDATKERLRALGYAN